MMRPIFDRHLYVSVITIFSFRDGVYYPAKMTYIYIYM